MSKRKATPEPVGVDVIDLFLDQITAMVQATANKLGPGDELGTEAWLWRTLQVNAKAKAEIAEAFAKGALRGGCPT